MLAKTKPAGGRVSSKEAVKNKTWINNIITDSAVNVNVGIWLDNQLDRTIKGPALYFVYADDRTLLYIGIVHSPNRSIKKRLGEHYHPRSKTYGTPLGWKIEQNLPHSRNWSLLILKTDQDVIELEKQLIKELRPKVNFYYHPDKTAKDMRQWGYYR